MPKKIVQGLMALALLLAAGCSGARRPVPGGIAPYRMGGAPPARPVAPPPAAIQPLAPTGSLLQVRAVTNTPSSAQPLPGAVAPKFVPAATALPPLTGAVKTASTYLVKGGDQIVVFLRGIPNEQQIEDVVDEQGYISLPYINEIMAAGKSSSELERAIRQMYLSQQIYKNVSVNVVLPAQSYYVRGEVRQAGRFPLMSGVTLVQAIASAGGYTEFANSRKVQLLRGSKSTYYDARDLETNPQRDVAIEAGDVIVVHRSVF